MQQRLQRPESAARRERCKRRGEDAFLVERMPLLEGATAASPACSFVCAGRWCCGGGGGGGKGAGGACVAVEEEAEEVMEEEEDAAATKINEALCGGAVGACEEEEEIEGVLVVFIVELA